MKNYIGTSENGWNTDTESPSEALDSVLLDGTTHEAWNRSVVVILLKKGDKTLLKNYRSMLLLSHFYKLFSRVTRIVSHAGLMTSSFANKPVSVKAILP